MEKEFVPYEQALALKELGFDETCFGYYDNKAVIIFNTNGQPVRKDWIWVKNQIIPTDMILAPTLSQIFRWFRDNHNLCSWVYQSNIELYHYSVLKDSRYLSPSIEFTTYEEAELECLKKLIEIVKIVKNK
jgi:hypothetical protein